jgi:hypothetical protein
VRLPSASATGGSTDMFIPALNKKMILDDYGSLQHIEDNKIYAYDVNSLYPSVMKDNDFPIGNPAQVDFNSFYLNDNEESNKLFGHFYCEITAGLAYARQRRFEISNFTNSL